jgi:hypothetical protein
MSQLMLTDLPTVPKQIATLAELASRLHALPTAGLPANDEDPLDELRRRAAVDPAIEAELANELGWLARRRPPATTAVACHGELNPAHVHLDRTDLAGAVPVNWTTARLAEPAYDVAGTLTTFWCVPLYVDNPIYRRAVQMAVDPMISAFGDAYRASAGTELDDTALRYWQVHHLTRHAIDALRSQHGHTFGPWDTAAGIVNPPEALEAIRTRIRDTAAG